MVSYRTVAESLRDYNPTLYYAATGHRTHRGNVLDFVHNPFIVRLYQDTWHYICVKKSTQCGVSEWLLCVVIPGAINGRNIFYVLPDYGIVKRFVMERFDKTMQFTPAYLKVRAGEKFNRASSITMKQIGPGTISFAGSTVENAFLEFAADWYVVDELDKCDRDNLKMGWERLSNAEETVRREIKVSNPSITGYGIDEEYANSDQRKWFIKHDCGAHVHPDFFKHVIRQVDNDIFVYADKEYDPASGQDCRLICDSCGRPIDRRGQGEWIAQYPGHDHHGYEISKLFSAKVKLTDLVERYQAGEHDPAAMIRFYNGDLGLAYDAPGARIPLEVLAECLGDYHLGAVPADGVCVAGCDVGSLFHLVIGHLTYGRPGVRIVEALELRTPEEVLDALRKYKVNTFVIDAMPETRISRAIIHRLKNGFMCYYSRGHKDQVNRERIVTVDRTVALDNVKVAYSTKALQLPAEMAGVPNFYDHTVASTRVFNPEANGGEGEYLWINGSKPDHYFHATGYMLTATRLLKLTQGA